jgi:hypothetical protein
MPIEFTPHPILDAPSDEEILLLAKKDPKLLEDLHRAHEGRIEAATNDPVRYGFDLDGWGRIRNGLKEYNEVLTLGGNRSGKTTGCAKIIMQAVMENMNGHIVCFLTECRYIRQGSASRDVGDDAQGVPEEDQEHGGIH